MAGAGVHAETVNGFCATIGGPPRRPGHDPMRRIGRCVEVGCEDRRSNKQPASANRYDYDTGITVVESVGARGIRGGW